MKRCRICGQLYNSEFCPKCGTQFMPDVACPSCGSQCNPYWEICPTCGAALESVLGDITLSSNDDYENDEHKARRNLWDALHEAEPDSEECIAIAKKLGEIAPGDYFSNFVITVFSGDEKSIEKFLLCTSNKDMRVYADTVMDFVIKRLTSGLFYSVWNFINQAFPKESYAYTKYLDIYENAAEKIDRKIFNVNVKRDVYISYSDADVTNAVSLCEYLEKEGISCFIRQRNMRHGSEASEYPDKLVFSAIDSCEVFVFISSKSSRDKNCGALSKELTYLYFGDRQRAPVSYNKTPYDRFPGKHKKPRVELVEDRYSYTKIDTAVRVVFWGFKRVSEREEVLNRVRYFLERQPVAMNSNVRRVNPSSEELSDTLDKLTEYVNEREKNVLETVDSSLEKWDFEKAYESLNRLKRLEIACIGKCRGAVIYRMLLCDYGASNADLLEERLVENGWDIKQNENFKQLIRCPKCTEKSLVSEIAVSVDNEIAKKAQKQKEDKERRRRDEKERKAADRRKKLEEAVNNLRFFGGAGLKKSEKVIAVVFGIAGLSIFIVFAAITSGTARNWLIATAILFSELFASVSIKRHSLEVWDTYATVAQCVLISAGTFATIYCDEIVSIYAVMFFVGMLANGLLYFIGGEYYSDRVLGIGHVFASIILLIINALICNGITGFFGGWTAILFILTYTLLFISGCYSLRGGQHRKPGGCTLPDLLMGFIVCICVLGYVQGYIQDEIDFGLLFADSYQHLWPSLLMISFLLVAGAGEIIKTVKHKCFAFCIISIFYEIFCAVYFIVDMAYLFV